MSEIDMGKQIYNVGKIALFVILFQCSLADMEQKDNRITELESQLAVAKHEIAILNAEYRDAEESGLTIDALVIKLRSELKRKDEALETVANWTEDHDWEYGDVGLFARQALKGGGE